jgi:hypothetical protein
MVKTSNGHCNVPRPVVVARRQYKTRARLTLLLSFVPGYVLSAYTRNLLDPGLSFLQSGATTTVRVYSAFIKQDRHSELIVRRPCRPIFSTQKLIRKLETNVNSNGVNSEGGTQDNSEDKQRIPRVCESASSSPNPLLASVQPFLNLRMNLSRHAHNQSFVLLSEESKVFSACHLNRSHAYC